MASKTKIANLALIKIGAGRITDITENTEAAKLANEIFDDMVEEVAVEGPWTSCVTRQELAVNVATPAYEFTYQFTLPTDPYCLKVLSINEDIAGTYPFKVEGRKLLTTVNTLKIKYIFRNLDTGTYDPMFKRALVFRLAAELAYPLTANRTMAAQMTEMYNKVVQDGLAIDNQQGSTDDIITPTLTSDVRLG